MKGNSGGRRLTDMSTTTQSTKFGLQTHKTSEPCFFSKYQEELITENASGKHTWL